MRHVSCPTVCAECQSKIQSLAIIGSSPIMYICTHSTRASDAVVVLAHLANCCIVQYDVHGPMLAARAQRFIEDAQALVADHLATARAG
jgi:hypothetical protein